MNLSPPSPKQAARGGFHHGLTVLVGALAVACTRADPAPAAEPNSRWSDSTQAAPTTASDKAPVGLQGPNLHAVYRECAGSMFVETVADEVFVTYTSDGYGRVDRLGRGPGVTRSATLDLDPGLESRAMHARMLGLPGPEVPKQACSGKCSHGNRWPWQPLAEIVDLFGASPDNLFVSAKFISNNDAVWNHRVFRYRDGRWLPSVDALPFVLEWPAGQVMAFEDYGPNGPIFTLLDGKGPVPNVGDLLPTIGKSLGQQLEDYDAANFECLDLDHSRTGSLVAVLTHDAEDDSLGTWIMVWSDPAKRPRFERVTEDVANHASVLVAGPRAFIQIDEALHEWADDTTRPLPKLAHSVRGDCDPGDGKATLAGVDPQGQLWAFSGSCIAGFSEGIWTAETLPGAKQVLQVAGVEFGAPWAIDFEYEIWSKTDGVWARAQLVEPRKSSNVQEWVGTMLWVTAPGEAWVSKSYETSVRNDGIPFRTGLSTDLYTTRAVDETLSCRTTPMQ